jgi:hypothetical protein
MLRRYFTRSIIQASCAFEIFSSENLLRGLRPVRLVHSRLRRFSRIGKAFYLSYSFHSIKLVPFLSIPDGKGFYAFNFCK